MSTQKENFAKGTRLLLRAVSKNMEKMWRRIFLTKRKSRRRYNRDCNRPKYLHFVIRAIDFSKVPGARFPCHESHDSCSRAPTSSPPFPPSSSLLPVARRLPFDSINEQRNENAFVERVVSRSPHLMARPIMANGSTMRDIQVETLATSGEFSGRFSLRRSRPF